MMLGMITIAATLSSLFTSALAHKTQCTKKTFASLKVKNIEIISFNVTAARGFSTSGRNATGGVGIIPDIPGTPAPTLDICLIVLAYTHPGKNDVVNTYIGLPLDAKDWNSRFLMDGGGGWYSGGESEVLSPVLSGYASSSTDGGHDNTASTVDWGLTKDGKTNWPALWDFSSVAIAEAAVLGKLATKIYYGESPKYSYWHGCSTGGRQGHAMAQLHPELFDGIVGGAPAVSWDKFAAAGLWAPFLSQLLDTRPPKCVLDTFTSAATAACDELDGVKDGIIAYPGQCHFKASSLVGQTVYCTEPDGKITITKKMAQLVAAIWEGPRSSDGHFKWYGFHYDSSLASMLGTTCKSVDDCTVVPFPIAEDWVKVFLARDPSFTLEGLTRADYDKLFRQSVREYAPVIGTGSVDLSKMKKAGTKMLAWHGMADQLVPTNGTVDYYDRARNFDRHVADYYRFFLAPGVTHCGFGNGFDPSNTVFDTLKAWVEEAAVPDRLEAVAAAVSPSNTSETRTGYLCPYPQVFTFIGGDPNSPSSFTCV
ncbi:hypothetical protein N7532_001173 [Penicillium argentinense]|uniref:Carboxylic ester hydrolase n=1 Tax=Penicillium argentinense TaxID=1131581 RepID=A0A9W9KM69_9EURO|nr:uncharacterized protein N7532_001173 [Penicillium argentinense]KAJ5110638.1 hypothetical protein N7532_001173 [Penicillium argentinense]